MQLWLDIILYVTWITFGIDFDLGIATKFIVRKFVSNCYVYMCGYLCYMYRNKQLHDKMYCLKFI